MKKLAFAIVTAIIVGTSAPAADAMNLASLARPAPLAAEAEFATVADPAVCRDLACGLEGRRAAEIAPVLHIIFASVGGFVGKAGLQLAAAASAA